MLKVNHKLNTKMTHNHSHGSAQHPSIPEKVYNILAWLTSPSTRNALVLYGPIASGKTVAFWEAINQLKQINLRDRPIPMEVHLLTEGQSFMVYTMKEHHREHDQYDYQHNILGQKTIIMVTSDRIPGGMADLLFADVMKFERE